MIRLTRLLDATLLAILAVLAVVIAVSSVSLFSMSLLGARPVVITGASMAPAIEVGSLVVVSLIDGEDVEPGDVVTLELPDRSLVTHRVLDVHEENDRPVAVSTQGDANRSPDPVPAPIESIVGRVTHTIPFAGYAVAMLKTPSGIVGVLCLIGSFALGRRALRLSRNMEGEPGSPRVLPQTSPRHHFGALFAILLAISTVSSDALFVDTANVDENIFTTGTW